MMRTLAATALAAAITLAALLLPGASAADPPTLTDLAAEPAICRINFGGATDISDDTFYLSMDGDDDKVELYDVRLTKFGGRPVGGIISASDTAEANAEADYQAYTFAYYDADSSNRYGVGDGLLVGYNKNTGTLVDGTTASGEWWIRTLPYQDRPAGTLVLGSSPDFISFGAGLALAAAEHAYHDTDASSAFGPGEIAYFAPRAVATGDVPPLASVRLTAGTYAAGTQVAPGDADYAPSLTDPTTDPAFCRVEHGTSTDINDDAYYLSMDGDDDAVELYDVRIASYAGKPAGGILTQADSGEFKAADCAAATFAYYDKNTNDKLDLADGAFVGHNRNTGSLVETSSLTGDLWIRMVAAGTKAAGTLVLGSDADYAQYTVGKAAAGAEFAYHDLDSSSSYSYGDDGYIAAADIASGKAPPVGSVRLSHASYAFGTQVKAGDVDGPFAAATSTTATTTPTSQATNSTTPSNTSRVSIPPVEDKPAEEDKKGLPGPGLFLVAAALVVAIVLLGRRERR